MPIHPYECPKGHRSERLFLCGERVPATVTCGSCASRAKWVPGVPADISAHLRKVCHENERGEEAYKEWMNSPGVKKKLETGEYSVQDRAGVSPGGVR